MNYKPYTKKELALQYFPDSNPRTAVGHLMSWIRRCTPLWDELQQTGYYPACKAFTPRQVRAIVEYLGGGCVKIGTSSFFLFALRLFDRYIVMRQFS